MPVPPSRSGGKRPASIRGAKVPSFGYPGGKGLLRRWVVSHFPRRCGVYCEPFAGRGNVFFLARTVVQADSWWLNDLRTMPFFNAVIGVDLSGVPAAVPAGEGRKWVDRAAALDTLALSIEPSISYSGGGLVVSRFRMGTRKSGFHSIGERLWEAKKALVASMPRLTALDYRDVLSALGPGDFAYLDPPYIGASVGPYSGNDLDYAEMVATLLDARFRWVLSEYAHPYYVDAFGPPHATKRTQSMAQPLHNGTGWRVECLWHNHGKVV